MLDENLPTFLVTPPPERSKHETPILFTQYGSERTAAYTLRKPDPASPNSKNRYAIAIYDAFNPDVLFAEVLVIPEWTQPTLSIEQIRKNGGVPPPPEPILPSEFTIQLYNPDQQVVVRQKKSKSFNSTPTWYFDMPLQTFRQPSTSTLDKAQSDPVASEIAPKLGFKWKKDSKWAKDLVCFSSGRTTNPDGSKKKSKEPDITVAIFQQLKEVTLYEPNLQRVEIEDPKGFEVVVLLGAVAIRDIYFGNMTDIFNISDPPKPANPASTLNNRPGPFTRHQTPSHSLANGVPSESTAIAGHQSAVNATRPPRVPPTDPRSQWEIDAETARLRKQAEAEERERARREAAEQKQIKRMLEAEEKEKRQKQAEIDKETERLKKLYGDEQRKAEATLLRPNAPPRNSGSSTPYSRHSAPNVPTTSSNNQSRPFAPQDSHRHRQSPHVSFAPQPQFIPPPGTHQPYAGGPYLSGSNPGASSSSSFQKLKEKRSFFGFGGSSGGRERARSGSGFDDLAPEGPGRLLKKKSSMF